MFPSKKILSLVCSMLIASSCQLAFFAAPPPPPPPGTDKKSPIWTEFKQNQAAWEAAQAGDIPNPPPHTPPLANTPTGKLQTELGLLSASLKNLQKSLVHLSGKKGLTGLQDQLVALSKGGGKKPPVINKPHPTAVPGELTAADLPILAEQAGSSPIRDLLSPVTKDKLDQTEKESLARKIVKALSLTLQPVTATFSSLFITNEQKISQEIKNDNLQLIDFFSRLDGSRDKKDLKYIATNLRPTIIKVIKDDAAAPEPTPTKTDPSTIKIEFPNFTKDQWTIGYKKGEEETVKTAAQKLIQKYNLKQDKKEWDKEIEDTLTQQYKENASHAISKFKVAISQLFEPEETEEQIAANNLKLATKEFEDKLISATKEIILKETSGKNKKSLCTVLDVDEPDPNLSFEDFKKYLTDSFIPKIDPSKKPSTQFTGTFFQSSTKKSLKGNLETALQTTHSDARTQATLKQIDTTAFKKFLSEVF